MTLLRYFPRLVRDRLGRLGFFLGACVLLVGPQIAALRWAAVRSAAGDEAARGFRDGLALVPGGHPMSGLIGFMLAAGVLLLWEGIVARDRREGTFRPVLARPVSRPGYYVACWLASLTCLAAGAAALGAATGWAGAGLGRPFSAAGAGVAAGAYGLVLGSPIFLASTWLDRGDALVGAGFALLGPGLESLVGSGWLPAGVFRLVEPVFPPLGRLESVRDALFVGRAPDAGDAAAVAAYGIAFLVAGVLVIRYGEFRGR